jgi:hypothetical protein
MNRKKYLSIVFTAILVISILGTTVTSTIVEEEQSMGNSFMYPALPQKEVTPDCLLASKPTPEQVHLSWSTNDVYHTMTVMWFTQLKSDSIVLYDTVSHESPEGYAFAQVGTTHQVAPEKDRHRDPIETEFDGWYHEAELTGLNPGTTYYFRVGGQGDCLKEWNFKTIGLDEKVSFAVAGDSRRPWGEGQEIKYSPISISNWPWARDWVTTCAASESPDFVIFSGDMVADGNNQEQWNNWFDSMQEHLVTGDDRMIPIVSVIGNHEMGAHPDVESTYDWFKGLFANPENELWYSLDFPDLHIAILSATGGCVGTWWEPALEEAKTQASWLESDLAGSNAPWKVVVWHVPYYNGFVTGTGYASEPFLKYWSTIVENPEYGVDLAINGHVHNYMRSWPMHTTSIEEVPVDKPWTDVGYKACYELLGDSSEGVTYVVQGCWGAPTDPYVRGGKCDIRDFIAAAAARPSYTMVELAADGMHLLTRDIQGNVLDEAILPYTTTEFPIPEYEYVI